MSRARSCATAIVFAAVLWGLGGSPAAAPGAPGQRRKLTRTQRNTTGWLIRRVDRVVAGELPGGDAWLKLRPHFLRGPDGNTYVPFTLLIDEAPVGFDSVALYLRAMKRTEPIDEDGPKLDDLSGTPTGDLPINMAEKNGNFPNEIVASENSAMAASIQSALTRRPPARPEFEDVRFMKPSRPDRASPALVRSAMSLAPGDYDIYIAVGESQGEAESARSAVIVRSLSIPDLSGPGLAVSSIIVADRVQPLSGALSADEQVARPYAFGAAEVTPAVDPRFSPADRLSVVLFAYNLATRDGMPDASVEYRFFQTRTLLFRVE